VNAFNVHPVVEVAPFGLTSVAAILGIIAVMTLMSLKCAMIVGGLESPRCVLSVWTSKSLPMMKNGNSDRETWTALPDLPTLDRCDGGRLRRR
jgi:hypothetical protein